LERATPQASGSPDDQAATKSEMPKLDPARVPDDASALQVDTRVAGP
jgi:hypothetical protein